MIKALSKEMHVEEPCRLPGMSDTGVQCIRLHFLQHPHRGPNGVDMSREAIRRQVAQYNNQGMHGLDYHLPQAWCQPLHQREEEEAVDGPEDDAHQTGERQRCLLGHATGCLWPKRPTIRRLHHGHHVDHDSGSDSDGLDIRQGYQETPHLFA